MALDEATRHLVEAAARAATKPRHEMSPPEAREAMARIRTIIGKGPDLAEEAELLIPVPGAELRARKLVPSGELDGAIVYFHGGGWVVGELEDFDPLCRHLAVRTRCAVVSVEYRKAPEHPYPGPVEDAWQALRWVAASQQALFGRALPLLVGGDSAGGNLAIATTFRAREAGLALAGQLLFYPVADCDFERPSYRDPANQLMLTREAMQWYWNHYVADETRRHECEVSPVRAADLAGLPPALVITAEHDVLLDEGRDYARGLQEAGVPVIHRTWPGQIHAFLMMIDLLPGSAEALAFIGTAMGALRAGQQATGS